MRLRRVAVTFPGGNTTAVVFDGIDLRGAKSLNERLSTQLSRYVDQEIEQCCVATFPQDPRAVARVQMFGGEFCGNATRSVVWLACQGRDQEGLIEASGTNRLLPFKILDGLVSVEMPLPMDGEIAVETELGTLVKLDGITHLVIAGVPAASPRSILTQVLDEGLFDAREQPAFGVSCYDPADGTARFCVWVKEVDTIFDETACGSGTSAIGIAIAVGGSESRTLEITQPSGQLITCSTVVEEKSSEVQSSWIGGRVQVLFDGEVVLP